MDALHKLKQKLKSQTGASITFALLLFLVCAVVGSAVLVAGTAAAGRMSKVAEMDQRYYAVNSAARLLVDLMERDEIRYQVKEAVPAGQSTGGTGGDATGGSGDSGEKYEWFIKNGDIWTSPKDSDPLPLTLFLAKRALSMSENATGNTSFTIKPQLTTAGVKLNVTAQATITKGNTDNSADLLIELADAATAGSTAGNYRIKAYFTNVGGDSFFHWKLYDMESIRNSAVTAPSSDGTEGGTP